MLFSAQVFAGKGSSSGCKKKCGFFSKIGKAVKKAVKKTCKKIKKTAKKAAKKVKAVAKKAAHKVKIAVKTVGAKINNAVKDTYVAAKWKLTCKKKRLWVCGHVDKNGRWIKGHWRKHGTGKGGSGNTPGQGNNPGQGNSPEQGFEPLPPMDDPIDPMLPGSNIAQAPEDEYTPVEEGDYSDELIGDYNDETTIDEETTESAMAEPSTEAPAVEEVSVETMGRLMDDVVEQSNEITDFRKVAVANPDMSLSVATHDGVVGTYDKREEKSALIVKVITLELRKNKGKAGKFFTYYKYRMNKLSPNDRVILEDVTNQVRDTVEHGLGHADENQREEYKERLGEIDNY